MATVYRYSYSISPGKYFAAGIKSSLDIIIGQTDNIFIIEAYTDGNKGIKEELDKILESVDALDELVVFTDLLGGSITNQVLQFALKENVYILSGMNLPLLIEVIMADPETSVAEVIETAVSSAREQIVFVNQLIHSNKDNTEDD